MTMLWCVIIALPSMCYCNTYFNVKSTICSCYSKALGCYNNTYFCVSYSRMPKMTMLWCAIIAYILMLNLPYAYAIVKQGCAQLTLNIYLVDKLLLLNVTLTYMHKNKMNYIMSLYVYFVLGHLHYV